MLRQMGQPSVAFLSEAHAQKQFAPPEIIGVLRQS
jgi:hypothetical protein